MTKKKETKIQRAARLAKACGYTQIAAIVKAHYASKYYNLNDVDDVISYGWQAAHQNDYGWTGAVGTIGTSIDWAKTVLRSEILILQGQLDESQTLYVHERGINPQGRRVVDIKAHGPNALDNRYYGHIATHYFRPRPTGWRTTIINQYEKLGYEIKFVERDGEKQ